MKRISDRIDVLWSAEDADIFDQIYLNTDITNREEIDKAISEIKERGRTDFSQKYIEALENCNPKNFKIAEQYRNGVRPAVYYSAAIACFLMMLCNIFVMSLGSTLSVALFILAVVFGIKGFIYGMTWGTLTVDKRVFHPAIGGDEPVKKRGLLKAVLVIAFSGVIYIGSTIMLGNTLPQPVPDTEVLESVYPEIQEDILLPEVTEEVLYPEDEYTDLPEVDMPNEVTAMYFSAMQRYDFGTMASSMSYPDQLPTRQDFIDMAGADTMELLQVVMGEMEYEITNTTMDGQLAYVTVRATYPDTFAVINSMADATDHDSGFRRIAEQVISYADSDAQLVMNLWPEYAARYDLDTITVEDVVLCALVDGEWKIDMVPDTLLRVMSCGFDS